MPRFALVLLLSGITLATLWFAPGTLASGSGIVRIKAIAGGPYFTCALPEGPGVYCWGNVDDGQLGNGSFSSVEYSPTEVTSLQSTDIAAIGAGEYHVCAAPEAGGVVCWGSNISGQLGDGTWASSSVPVDVVGLDSAVVQLGGGWNHSCALTAEGAVYCWGHNAQGQLGNGTTSYGQNTPTEVVGLRGLVVAIGVGDHFSCALLGDGTVSCWGMNSVGALGDGTTESRHSPVQVAGITNAVGLSAGGFHACALLDAGSIRCWGLNQYGQLGDGTMGDGTEYSLDNFSTVPVDALGLDSSVSAIAAGFYHTCAVMSDETVQCWGNDVFGELGDGPVNFRPWPGNSTEPVHVPGLTDTHYLGSGFFRTCAVNSAGTLRCWGDGYTGDGSGQPGWVPLYVLFDADGDGCADGAEMRTAEGSEVWGGRRDAKNPWDVFDANGDRRQRMDDILLVVAQYFVDEGNPGYTESTDRTLEGPNAWNLGPPDGLQRVDDILNAIKQYFHDCIFNASSFP